MNITTHTSNIKVNISEVVGCISIKFYILVSQTIDWRFIKEQFPCLSNFYGRAQMYRNFQNSPSIVRIKKGSTSGWLFPNWTLHDLRKGQFISPGGRGLLVTLTRRHKYKRKSSVDTNMRNNGKYNTCDGDKDSRKESVFKKVLIRKRKD